MSVKGINLSHTYGLGSIFAFDALKDINFEIQDGDFIGIIGHTGSGKSTFIQHLNRLLLATSGCVILDGVDINGKGIMMKDVVKKVGVVFQYPEYQLFEDTIYKDIAFGAKNMGYDDIDGIVKESMELVGLDYEYYKDKAPFNLSGGQKRRVAIAGVLAMNPSVLVLDEPASGLDPIGREEIFDNIKILHEKKNLTTILVSHSMNDISNIADKIMVFNEGRLEMFDETKNVFNNVKMLESIGLDIPESKKLLMLLKEKGFDVNTDLYKNEDVINEIVNILKKG